jgi:outer membrane protein assembly factor BamA
MFIENYRLSSLLFFKTLLLWTFISIAVAAPAPLQPLIRTIIIEGNTRTATTIIRQELLFDIGQRLDPKRLAESERALRRLLYLGNIQLEVEEMAGGVVVTVRVEDLYARALSPMLAGEANELSYGVTGLDYNFRGRGQTLQLSGEHRAVSGQRVDLFYQAPRVAGSYHNLATNLGLEREGHDIRLSLSRPFNTLDTPLAYGVSLAHTTSIQRLYADQAQTARYQDRLAGGSLWITPSWGTQLKARPSLRLDVSDRGFNSTQQFSYAPQDRRRVVLSLGMTLWQPRYEKTSYVQRLGSIEDLQTGSWLFTRFGLSHQGLGSDRNYPFFQLQLAPRLRPHPQVYTYFSLFGSSRFNRNGYYNLSTRLSLLNYIRWRQVHTLALRLAWSSLSRSEDNIQFLLGVDRGVRGYAPRRFDGSRLFQLNLEARPTFYQHPSVVFAGAAFIDAGTAWDGTTLLQTPRWALGIGGRLGLPRVYNTPVLRTDLAYGLHDRQWQFSFGIGQYF